jgi:antitoxin YxxD
MDDFAFLKEYILSEPSKYDFESNQKHILYRLQKQEVEKIAKVITVPSELRKFWLEIGYGFFHRLPGYSINRFLGPQDYKLINLRESYYEFDPTLEYHQSFPDNMIFYEVNEGIYLTIEKYDINGKNAIYYFDEKIADSLVEFINKFDRELLYFEKG